MAHGGAAFVAPNDLALPWKGRIMTNQNNHHISASGGGNVVALRAEAPSSTSAVATEPMEGGSDGMPADFYLGDDGIYQMRPGDGEDLVPVRICSPLIVKGICSRPGGRGWGRVVAVEDPDGRWHELVLEQRDVANKSSKVLAPLFDRGLELATVDKASQSLGELLATWKPSTRYLRAERLGWADTDFSAFILGGERVLGEGQVVTDAVNADVSTSMCAKGTLDGWRANVAASCIDNPLMILAVSHAFSGPLLSVLGRDGGGFHLRGVSSRGKSTLLGVAASVWGAPSFVQSWRRTDNGIEGIAAACNDSLLILDELHQVDPRVVGNIVYMLGNGRGKSRMGSNGGMQDTLHWTVPLLSSGEVSLEQHMASVGHSTFAGQEIRLIDLAADARAHGAFDALHGEVNGRAFAEAMQRAGREHHGVAGPAFVERLMKHLDKRENFLRAIEAHCRSWGREIDLPPDGQVQRVMARFAIAAVAGELATRFGLTGWQKGMASSAALELFKEWVEARDGATRAEIDEAIERTRDYVSANVGRFLELGGAHGDAPDGWRDENWFYIRTERWKDIHDAGDPIEAARMHKDAGLLKTPNGGLQVKMGRQVEGRPRAYAVRASEVLRPAEA